MLEGPLSTNLWNGHYYGLPLNTNCKAAVVNLNVLKTLGFDAAPATMEEFVAACKEKAAGQYKLNVSGLGDWDLFLGIIPQFLVLQGIGTAKNGLIGTKAGLILLYVGAGICGNTFFLRGHMAALPKELEEAVKIDGGGHMTTFFRVMLPLALPSIGTLAIFCLQGTWEEFFSAKVILGAVANQITLPVMIQSLKGAHATRWEWIFSASILAQIPMILLFAVFQKRFVVSGLSDGSVKA